MSEATTRTFRVPAPTIRYSFLYADRLIYDHGGSERIASVVEVTVSRTSGGTLSAWVTGPFLKKDGEPGRHHRSSRVDFDQEQPLWLSKVIEDAGRRLA